ncbi:MAG: glycosyltransferase [Armatimonadetes bacterium]|nr:glycosyltransferase [Armatimonadota bacterium]
MRIVFAAPLFPLPPDGGAKIRLLRHLEVLSARHEVTLVTIPRTASDWNLLEELRRYGDLITIEAPHRRTPFHRVAYRGVYRAMAALRSWPVDAFYGCPGRFSEVVKNRALQTNADLVHYDFWFAALGDLHAQPYRRVVLEHDVEYIRRKRDYDTAPASKASKLKRIWLATERAECQVLRSVDTILAVTDRDRDEVIAAGAHQAITLPTGIDTEVCRPPETEPSGKRLVYVGAYSHHPNVDAMLWFAREIFPEVQRRHPDVELSIVGSQPPPEVTALGSLPGITVTGAVPDVAPFIQSANVSIAPLRVGSGIKGKIIEAMAFGRPVVTTSVGVEGMNLTNGENVIIGDTAEEFAAALSDLLSAPERALQIGRAGRRLVEERHSQSAADGRLLDVYEREVFQKPAPARSAQG